MRRVVLLLVTIGASLAAQPASIEGTVVDQTTGKPLDRVHVRLTGTEAYGAISDSSGHFSIALMPPGRYMLTVKRSGYVQLADSDRATLKDGQQLTDFKVKMALAAMLLGRVVDQNGGPVSDAEEDYRDALVTVEVHAGEKVSQDLKLSPAEKL